MVRPPAVCREKEWKPGAELEGGTEGHNTLFPPLNPSGACHTLVMDGKRKTVKKRKRGRKWRERAVRDSFRFESDKWKINQPLHLYFFNIISTFFNLSGR